MSEWRDEANRDWRSISSIFASGLSPGATPSFTRPGIPLRALFQRSENKLTSIGWRCGNRLGSSGRRGEFRSSSRKPAIRPIWLG